MAAELGTICCTEHGEQDVVDHTQIDSVRVVKLACQCEVRFDLVQVGDAVLFEGELFRVDWVGPGPAFDELELVNTETRFFTESYCVSYVAQDKLSRQMAQRNSFDIFYGTARGPSRYFSPNETSTRQPAKPRKTHAISTADLIKSEVKNLETRKPSGELAESVAEPAKEEDGLPVETGPIPRRDGDW